MDGREWMAGKTGRSECECMNSCKLMEDVQDEDAV